MAQKAAKTLAARNTNLLNRTHLTSLTLHLLYLLLHFLLHRPRSLTPYLLLTTPTLAIEFYLERLAGPVTIMRLTVVAAVPYAPPAKTSTAPV
ncbi:hypothetical protein ACJ72_06101 [Emergomyces africanus]|uniref:Uncharacterized protein n=1 Tax=Emergomyces africanus TaxID=1955775 RepID=A0A1B7NS63_9EURO|nr:hypothetical protein ACJ72_06101 [Emergomyces africanus]